MLSDQIHNQTDKILDLERTLDSKKEALKRTEDLLQIEMINRSSLETTKLELLSEVSGLKLRQVFRSNKVQLSRKKNISDDNGEGERGVASTIGENPSFGGKWPGWIQVQITKLQD